MKLAEITGWVEEHPTESIVIGAGGLIAILWLLGYFSSSSSTSNSGASSLAAAYYAAEAQQAVVGGQIQVATIQAAAQTAQTAAQANAAVAIANTQATAATTINGQNADAATTIEGTDQLLATYSNNGMIAATNASNNAAQLAITNSNNYTTALGAALAPGGIIPTELKMTGGTAGFNFGSLGTFSGQQDIPTNLNTLIGMGYTRSQAEAITGTPA